MSTIAIEIKMNNTVIEQQVRSSDKTELYILIILIKLTVFALLKIAKACANAYTSHNQRVIHRHNKTSIAEMQRKKEAKTDTSDHLETSPV